MAMNGTTNYGTPPVYGASPYGSQPAAAAVPADMQSLNASIDMALKSQMARGVVPTSMPQPVSAPTQTAAPVTAPAGPSADATDPANQGNITWALLMEMKQSSGQALTPGEQARYQGIMARANQGQPTTTIPTTTSPTAPTQPVTAPSQPDATPAQPMAQDEYDTEVKWAVAFEKSDEAKRYNAYNKEKKIRAGQAEGSPSMTDQQFATESAWAQQFAQTPDILRYKRIAAEVKRRQASGERTRPTGMLDKVKNFFSGLFGKFFKKKDPQPQAQPTQQPAQSQGGFPPTGQSAPAPTGR